MTATDRPTAPVAIQRITRVKPPPPEVMSLLAIHGSYFIEIPSEEMIKHQSMILFFRIQQYYQLQDKKKSHSAPAELVAEKLTCAFFLVFG
jgi:hypothetical protein